MNRLTRTLAALALAGAALSAHAISATIKREIPASMPAYLKGVPLATNAGPEDPAFDGLQVWVPNRMANTIQRYDAVSNKLNGTITLPASTGGARRLVFDGTYMWAFVLSEPRVYKYDTAGRLQSGFPITIRDIADRAVFDGDFIWASTNANTLERINVATRAVTSFPVSTQGAVGFDGRYVWISGDTLVKFDPASGREVSSIPGLAASTGTSGLTFDGTFMWVNSDMATAQVYKVNVQTNQVVAMVDVPLGVHGNAFDGTLLWVPCTDASQVAKIDVRTNQVVGVVDMPPGSSPHDIVFDGMFMWVTAEGTNAVHKYFAKF